MRLKKPVSFLWLLLFSFSLPHSYGQQKTLKLLFVGNSLTYVNDLPSMIKEIGKQDGINIIYDAYLFPDYSLEDHWNDGKVQEEIRKGDYDFVVAQQGPSALPESQVLLLEYTKRFADVCNKGKTKLALYMVWPSKARSFDLDNVIVSYTKAAGKTSSLLCPAGLGWKYAWKADSSLTLYSPDNFHPSVTGSTLAACVIYGSLAAKHNFDFIDYNKCSWKDEMTEATFRVLKEAALKAMDK